MINKLVTRNIRSDNPNALKAPPGHKLILVFGVVAVPEDAPVGDNRVVSVDELKLNITDGKPLPEKYAVWDAPAVCEEVFKCTMREASEMSRADRGLALIRDGKTNDPELQEIAKRLKTVVKCLPIFDTMRQVFQAIINAADRSSSK